MVMSKLTHAVIEIRHSFNRKKKKRVSIFRINIYSSLFASGTDMHVECCTQ